MSIQERSELRKKKIRGYKAKNHKDAEVWDLMFWQSMTPQDRLSALVHLHNDVKKVEQGKKSQKI